MGPEADADGRTWPAPSGAGLRLPREARLRSRKDFARIHAGGLRARGRCILVVAAPGLNPATPRLGLSVGLRYSKSAVARNRFRRQCREAFRLERRHLPHLDLVVIPVARPGQHSLAHLRDELVTLARRIQRKLGDACGH